MTEDCENTNELLDALQTEIDRVQGERLCDAINAIKAKHGITIGDDRVVTWLCEADAERYLNALRALPDNAGWNAAWDACPYAEPPERVTES